MNPFPEHASRHRPAVTLRPTTRDDLPRLYEIQCEPAGCAMAGVNARTHEAFYEVWDRIFQDPRIIPRTILADGVLAGGINCFQVEEIDYVGYWLAQEFWGRGVAGNALVQFLQICTRRPLRANVSTGNPASLRVLAKAGFRESSRTMEPGTERYIAGEVAHFILE